MSIACKARGYIKDHNGIKVAYELIDTAGTTMTVDINSIKNALLSKQIIATNLKVTSDNKLIYKNIEAPAKVSKLANSIAAKALVKCGCPYIDGFYFRVDFKETGMHLECRLDCLNFGLFGDDATPDIYWNELPELSIQQLNMKLSTILNSYADTLKQIIIKKKPYAVAEGQHIINIKTSDVIAHSEGISRIPGIVIDYGHNGEVYGEKAEWIKVTDRDANLIVCIDTKLQRMDRDEENPLIVLKDSIFKNLVVFASDSSSNYDLYIENCIIDNMKITSTYIKMKYSIVKNTIISKCSELEFFGLCYANTIRYTSDNLQYHYNNINIERLLAHNIYIETTAKSYRINYGSCGCAYIKKIFVNANDVYFIGTSGCIEFLSIKAREIKLAFQTGNAYDRNFENKFKYLFMDVTSDDMRNKILDIYNANNGEFSHANSITTRVQVDGSKLDIEKFAYKARLEVKNTDTEVTIDKLLNQDVLNSIVNASILGKEVLNKYKFERSLLILEGDNIVFNDIIIPPCNPKFAKCDINIIDETVAHFQITIKNSIRASGKSASYLLKRVVGSLVNLSRLNPINVYYGTQAYNVLASAGANINVLNKEAMPDNMKRARIKEKMLGVNIIDTYYKKVEQALDNCIKNENENEMCAFDTGISIQIPDDILLRFGIKMNDKQDNMTVASLANVIKLLQKFPANNFLFTNEIFERIRHNINIKIEHKIIFSYNNVTIHSFTIIHTSIINKIDTYIAVINGINLIYMTYIGNCALVSNRGLSKQTTLAVQALRDFKSFDFSTCTFEQDKIASTSKNPEQFVDTVQRFVNRIPCYLYDADSNVIATLDSEDNVVTFGVKGDKVYKKVFDVNHMKANIDSITYIKTNDQFDKILEDIKEAYKNSVLVQLKKYTTPATSSSISDNGEEYVPTCKVCSFWQLAHELKKTGTSVLSISDIYKILELPFFNSITEKDALVLIAKARKRSNSRLLTDDTYTVEFYEFSGTCKKVLGELMTDISYIYIINSSMGSEYYVADTRIDEIVTKLTSIANYNNFQPKVDFENYQREFSKALDYVTINNRYIRLDEIALRLEKAEHQYEVTSMDARNLYYAIDNAREHGYANLEKNILKLMGMTMEQYDRIISNPEYAWDPARSIRPRHIAQMPFSEELVKLLKTTNAEFQLLQTRYEIAQQVDKLHDISDEHLTVLYDTKKYLFNNDGYKYYTSLLKIIMCNKTGYCYLVSYTHDYIIPIIRIASFMDAMILRKRISTELKRLGKREESLIYNIVGSDDNELIDSTDLQIKNTKIAELFPRKYRYLACYVPDVPEYEKCNYNIDARENESITELKEFSEAYLMHCINTGNITLRPNIPYGYTYTKTYGTVDKKYSIKEYYNKKENRYAYDINSETIALSEIKFEDIFN